MENPIEMKRRLVQERIQKSFEDGLNIDDLEKARQGVYSDNPFNRRLMRVGQKYGESKNIFKPGHKVKATLPTGKVIEAVYVEPYGKDRHTVKVDGKLYGVTTDKLVKIGGQYAGRKRNMSRAEIDKLETKMDELKDEYNDLKREYKQTQIDMEEELAAAGEDVINDGNHPLVVHYSKELERIETKIKKVKDAYSKTKDKFDAYWA